MPFLYTARKKNLPCRTGHGISMSYGTDLSTFKNGCFLDIESLFSKTLYSNNIFIDDTGFKKVQKQTTVKPL